MKKLIPSSFSPKVAVLPLITIAFLLTNLAWAGPSGPASRGGAPSTPSKKYSTPAEEVAPEKQPKPTIEEPLITEEEGKKEEKVVTDDQSPQYYRKDGGFFSIGGGAGGDADAVNLSLEFGGYSGQKNINHLYGIGLTFLFNSDDVPTGTLEYPVPHNLYTSLGTRQKGEEFGIYGKYGLEILKGSGFFIHALAGISFSEEIDLARSNVTGWYYEQSSSTETNGMYGGGVSYFLYDSKFGLQLEYDNRRGVTGLIGFVW